jgi:hypothetical protein
MCGRAHHPGPFGLPGGSSNEELSGALGLSLAVLPSPFCLLINRLRPLPFRTSKGFQAGPHSIGSARPAREQAGVRGACRRKTIRLKEACGGCGDYNHREIKIRVTTTESCDCWVWSSDLDSSLV